MSDRGLRSDIAVSAQARVDVADLGDVVERLRARDRSLAGLPAAAHGPAGNVVLFAPRRPLAPEAPAVRCEAGSRPAPFAPREAGSARLAVVLAASLAAHAGALAFFDRAPPPLASVGEVAISVELVLGTQVAAGEASAPSPSEMQSAAAPETENPQDDVPQAARGEPEEPLREPEAAPADPGPPPPEPESAPTAAEAPAAPESERAPTAEPKLETAALPDTSPPEGPEPAPPAQAEPARPDPAIPLPPRRKAGTEPAPERAEPLERKPARSPRADRQTPRTAARGDDGRTRSAPAAAPSTASSGIGIGRSDALANYRGMVAAHLARHKRFPADARARGDQGSATVTFSIDGRGRVTGVRLARGSGIGSFDQESQAMVRRASPFPAPPGGRGMTFTVPVNFFLR